MCIRDRVEAPYKLVVAGAGHLVGLERPDFVTRAVQDGLARWT